MMGQSTVALRVAVLDRYWVDTRVDAKAGPTGFQTDHYLVAQRVESTDVLTVV